MRDDPEVVVDEFVEKITERRKSSLDEQIEEVRGCLETIEGNVEKFLGLDRPPYMVPGMVSSTIYDWVEDEITEVLFQALSASAMIRRHVKFAFSGDLKDKAWEDRDGILEAAREGSRKNSRTARKRSS